MARKYYRKDGSGCYVKGAVQGRFCTWQIRQGYEEVLPYELTPDEVAYWVDLGVLYTGKGGLGDEEAWMQADPVGQDGRRALHGLTLRDGSILAYPSQRKPRKPPILKSRGCLFFLLWVFTLLVVLVVWKIWRGTYHF